MTAKTLIYISSIIISTILLWPQPAAAQPATLQKGSGSFVFNDYAPLASKPVRVWYYNPVADPSALPIVFVMHGVNRNADTYRDNWVALADEYKLLIIAPEFSKEDFPGADQYNLGGMFNDQGMPQPEETWAYSLIEPIFDHVKTLTHNHAAGYAIFGHSAGAQFVHRLLLFKPNIRATTIVSANAGWYTMPDFHTNFPYGLAGTSATTDKLKQVLARNMVVLLGTADTVASGRNLRKTPEAMAQGPYRLARGQAFYHKAQTVADSLHTPLHWHMQKVPGVAHNNAAMSQAAARIIVKELALSNTPPPPPATAAPAYTKQIKKLANQKRVKQAFEALVADRPQTNQDHITLTEIPAPPFHEAARGARYAQMLKAAGADSVWIDSVGNVIGKRNGTQGKRTIVLEAHLDTVFPEGTDVQVKHSGDTLRAPGIGDDTRALADILSILRAINKANLRTEADILFIGTVGEEGQGDLRGVKYLFSEAAGITIDAYIAIDGGSLGRIIHRALGSHRYRVTFQGPGGHSWGDFGAPNPHHALGRAIHYWSILADSLIATPGDKVSYSVGMIGGGTSVNSIPFESWMEVDMRSENKERLAAMDHLLHQAVQHALEEENQHKQNGIDLTVQMPMIGDRPSGALDSNLPLIQQTIAATAFVGGKPRLTASSTNANIPIFREVPAVTLGRDGTSGQAHSLQEWWTPANDFSMLKKTLLILLAQANLAR